MTGLTETGHVVAAFAAGGADDVTQPIRAQEALARIAVDMGSARERLHEKIQATQARNALDAFGYATMAIHLDDTTRALRGLAAGARAPADARLLRRRAGANPRNGARLAAHRVFINCERPRTAPAAEPRRDEGRSAPARVRAAAAHRRRRSADRDARAVGYRCGGGNGQAFKLTLREAEVRHWLAKGKPNRDIGDILASSPATVKKHLERVHVKLGVETRTVAAGLSMARLRQLNLSVTG